MIQFFIAVFLAYAIMTWWIRSMKIRRNYGDLCVVITGCDSGFGQELAYRLDKHKFNVYATCLTTEGATLLDTTTSESLRTAIVDITNPDDVAQLVKIVKSGIPNENVLWAVVNNAGTQGTSGIGGLLKKEDYLQVMNVNIFGLMEVTQQFLPLLRKSKGRIINTSSLSGKVATSFLQPYALSKFCVEAYSDCLRRELYHEGISVSVVEPGAFATQILAFTERENIRLNYQRTLDRATAEEREYYGSDYPDKVADAFQKQKRIHISKHTYKVVNAYFHAITAKYPKARYTVGVDAKILIGLHWMLPEWIFDFIFAHSSIGGVKPVALCK